MYRLLKNYSYLMLLSAVMYSCGDRTVTSEQELPDQPNIVWFISEDNSQYLGAYGNEFVHTPTLDSLAALSVRYENAYSNAPVCAPSRSGIITGILPVSIGTQHMRSQVEVPSDYKYYIDHLKDDGYFLSLRQKRDYNIAGRESDAWDIDDWWVFSEALEGRKPGQPFYMFYNTWQTHEGKIHGPEEGYNYFKATFEHLGQKVVDSLWGTVRMVDTSSVEIPEYLPDIPEVRQDLALYYSLMQALDIEFRYFLEDLRKSGELENTIIIYSSDHGGVMARSKRFAMETGLKIPLYIWYPEKYKHLAPSEPGSSLEELVTLIDIPVTILDVARVSAPEGYHGRSLLNKGHKEDIAFGFRDRMDESYDMVRTIRQGDFRYTINFYPQRPDGQHISYLWKAPNVGAWERYHKEGNTDANTSLFWKPRHAEGLYHVTSDPWQLNNLAGDPSYSRVLDSMRNVQVTYLKKIGDLGFIPEGLLFERYRHDSTMYINQYSREKLEGIISKGVQSTISPSLQLVTSMMNDPEPAIRFWAAMAALNLARNGTFAVDDILTRLSEDENGDVRAVAAEGLYFTGKKELARDVLVGLLESENNYVVVRAMETIDFLDLEVDGLEDKLSELQDMKVTPGHSYVQRITEKLQAKL